MKQSGSPTYVWSLPYCLLQVCPQPPVQGILVPCATGRQGENQLSE